LSELSENSSLIFFGGGGREEVERQGTLITPWRRGGERKVLFWGRKKGGQTNTRD